MARAIWKGEIAFGLVNIPVALTSAEIRPDIQLHMVDSQNHARIRYERVNSDTGEEVPWDRMIKGYEHEDGQFILLTDDDLKSVQPQLTKTIEITEFVSLADIDPLLFDKPYYLEPDKRGRRAYALLREALRKSGKAGIARVVIRTREYLTSMFVRDDVLILMLLRFPQEVRQSSKLDLPSSKDAALAPVKKELDLATRLIDEMTEKWNPEDYHDEYRDALMEFIERKIAGGETVDDVKQTDADKDKGNEKVLDLAEYLQRSFKQPGPGGPNVKAKKSPAKKVTAKKTNAKKQSKSA